MKAKQLFLRCLAKKEDGLYLAFCLDLNLAAQGSTLDEAKSNLEGQINEYIYDAIMGDEKDHAEYLLTRRAPVSLFALYYLALVMEKIHLSCGHIFNVLKPVKLYPAHT